MLFDLCINNNLNLNKIFRLVIDTTLSSIQSNIGIIIVFDSFFVKYDNALEVKPNICSLAIINHTWLVISHMKVIKVIQTSSEKPHVYVCEIIRITLLLI